MEREMHVAVEYFLHVSYQLGVLVLFELCVCYVFVMCFLGYICINNFVQISPRHGKVVRNAGPQKTKLHSHAYDMCHLTSFQWKW